jgi:hypothetical protein
MALSLIHTLHNSLQHTLRLLIFFFTYSSLVTDPNVLFCSRRYRLATVSHQTHGSKCPQAKVTLRPTVSRIVSLGVKPHLEPKSGFLLLSDSCGFVDGQIL